MLRMYSTSFMCVCVHYKLCELRMRRLFIADLCVSTLVAVAGFWLCSDLPRPRPEKKRHRKMAPKKKKSTETGAPGKKKRRQL